MLTEIALLSSPECAVIRDEVLGLRDLWTQRHPQLPFFTLGAPSYLDAVDDVAAYRDQTSRTTPVLRARLGWLYERLRRGLAAELGQSAHYDDERSLPGFHVFFCHPAFRKVPASVHVDRQFERLDWSAHAGADFLHPLSFTLPIALPALGAGLRVWEVLVGVGEHPSPAELRERMAQSSPEVHSYTLGRLVLHSGNQVHQIEPQRAADDTGERMTLQGHAIRCADGWHLYW